jgi:nicotinamidase-related amidase
MSDAWAPFALLLIDIQNDFWTDEMRAAFPTFEKDVASLLDTCRSSGIDVLHLRAVFREDRSDWMVRYRMSGKIPCIEGTPGAEVFACAKAVDGEKVVVKQTFDGFLNPELGHHLETNGKRFVFVAGLVTSVCVLLTAASAAQRGYLVTVVEDCCADAPEAHAHTLDRYPFIFSRTTSDKLVTARDEWLAMIDGITD